MPEKEDPFKNIVDKATETIIKELYSDFKIWALSGIKIAFKKINHLKRRKYSQLQDLISDLKKGNLKNGEIIEIKCKFSSFGPFIKRLYISPLVGLNTSNRLGPPLIHQNPFMGIFAQFTSHLIPIGVYPPISKNITQVQLYPSDSEAFGLFGKLPGVNEIVPSFNALIKTEYLNDAHKSCKLTGKVRCISQQDFINAGYNLEDYEIVRSIGNIWFIDATDLDSDCWIDDNEIREFWGGLYSAGHIESKGIPLKPLIDGYLDKLTPHIKDLKVIQNQAKNKEIYIFGKGFRMVQHIKYPIYAIHYDINVGTNYEKQKEEYEKILNSVLHNIKDTCENNSIELFNPYDLDFNYSNSGESYKILESLGAKNIKDPLALAIREWIKKNDS